MPHRDSISTTTATPEPAITSGRTVLVLGAICATLTLASLPGCYRRVVSVKNNPGYQGKVYEANLPEGEQNAVVDLFTIERTRPVPK